MSSIAPLSNRSAPAPLNAEAAAGWAIKEGWLGDATLTEQQLAASGTRYKVIPERTWQSLALSSKIRKSPKIDLFSIPGETLWQNRSAKVQIVEENGNFHLLVKPAKEVSFERISEDDYLSMKALLGPISDALEAVFGFPDFAEYLVESEKTFGFEILPPPPSQTLETVDMLAKDRRNLYILSQGQWQGYSLPKQNLGILKIALRRQLHKPNPDRAPRPFTAKRLETRIPDALHFRVHSFCKLNSYLGFPLKPVSAPPTTPTLPESRARKAKKRCVFCHLKDSDEKVHEGKTIDLLVNINSYARKCDAISKHLLLIPKRHEEDSPFLSPEEILEERQMILKLRKTYKEVDPNGKWIVWRQNGIKAGQSVPHTHLQMLSLTGKDEEIAEYFHLMVSDIYDGPKNKKANSNNLLLRNLLADTTHTSRQPDAIAKHDER